MGVNITDNTNDNFSIKQLIINAFKQMSISQLETHCPTNVSFRYKKDDFLFRLKKHFKEYKRKGDTAFMVVQGILIKKKQECGFKPDIGFFFIGNKTQDYFTLGCCEDEHSYFKFGSLYSNYHFLEMPNSYISLNSDHSFSYVSTYDSLGFWNNFKKLPPIKLYLELLDKDDRLRLKDIKYWLSLNEHKYINKGYDIENYEGVCASDCELENQTYSLYIGFYKLNICINNNTYFKEKQEEFEALNANTEETNKWLKTHKTDIEKRIEQFDSLCWRNNEKYDYTDHVYLFSSCLKQIYFRLAEFHSTYSFIETYYKLTYKRIEGIIINIGEEIKSYDHQTGLLQKQKRTVTVADKTSFDISFLNKKLEFLENYNIGDTITAYCKEHLFEDKIYYLAWRVTN